MGRSTVVNEAEARDLLTRETEQLRQRSYQELLSLRDEVSAYEVVGSSGTAYTVEVRAVWDDKAKGHLQVMADIDDGVTKRVLGIFHIAVPIVDGFIIAPDGSFVGEPPE